jgi:hypothetical protein
MKGGSKNSTWKYEPKTRPTLSYEWDTKRGKANGRLWELGTKPKSARDEAGEPVWIGGDYDDDFVKIDGEWKFQTVRLKLAFITPFDQSWVKKPFAD